MRSHRDASHAPLEPRPDVMKSGTLASLAGVSTDTLRHYERMGVLPAPQRAANGYRQYPAHALDRVRLVRRGLAVGLTLAELAPVLRERDRNRSPCRMVRALVADRLARLELEQKALAARCAALRRTLADWDRRLARTRRGSQARLLDHVVIPEPKAVPRSFEGGQDA